MRPLLEVRCTQPPLIFQVWADLQFDSYHFVAKRGGQEILHSYWRATPGRTWAEAFDKFIATAMTIGR